MGEAHQVEVHPGGAELRQRGVVVQRRHRLFRTRHAFIIIGRHGHVTGQG
jgi:hypothetical protein